MKHLPSFRLCFLAVAVGALGSVVVLSSGALVACSSISDTSPIPDGDASDLDGGYTPPYEDGSTPPPPTIDAGPAPAAGRIRLANLLQGTSSVDLCVRSDAAGSVWEGQKITVNSPAPKSDGLKFGEVSTHIFLPVPVVAGQRYQFRIVALGGACEGDAGAPLVSIPSGTNTSLAQGGGLTLAVVGIAGVDAGPEAAPKAVVVSDVLSPPAAVANLRVVHGVSDLPAFDVLVNAETAIQGVKYGSALGFPYSNPTGFASLAGGVPEGATITLKAGTTVRTFKVPARVRRGVAVTLFASGRVDGTPALALSLCADRSPPDGEPLASCTNLPQVK